MLTVRRSPPQHLYNVESEIEETDYDSVEETSSVLSTEEWEDESDSWETDNGVTTEDDSHANNLDATVTATPTPTPTGSSVFIIPPQEGGKADVTSPTPREEGEASVACPASGGGDHRWCLSRACPLHSAGFNAETLVCFC